MPKVSILADSLNPITENRLTTYLLEGFPKQLLAQFNTHGLICRNAESSRARPTKAVLEQVKNDPYVPIFTKNQKGMVGDLITNPGLERKFNLDLRDRVVEYIEAAIAEGLDIHKENLNRYLEPWMKVSLIASSTFWTNSDSRNPGFFELRNHPHAQPNFQQFAKEMQELYLTSKPIELSVGQWHKPWVDDSIEINTARSAGISYASHNKDMPAEKRMALHDGLMNDAHLSPFAHCAMCICPGMLYEGFRVVDAWNFEATILGCGDALVDTSAWIQTAQFGGFLQYRKLVEKRIWN